MGVKCFGDWLLTLRGGLSHELAAPPPPAKGKRSEEEITALRKCTLDWALEASGWPSRMLRLRHGGRRFIRSSVP